MTTVATTIRTAMAQAAYDAIGASPVVEIYDASSVRLVQFNLASTWGAVQTTSILMSSATSTAEATGTASSYAIKSSVGYTLISGDVVELGSTGDLIIDRVDLIIGMPVTISSWRLGV